MTNRIFKVNPLTGLLVFVLFAALTWFIISGLWKLLSVIAPFLFLASFLLDKKVPINFFKWLGKQFKVNVIGGVFVTLMCGLAFPFVFAFLFARSLMNYRMGKSKRAAQQDLEGDYIEFEELEDPIELPRLNKR
jgi:hypothetical protein